MSYIGTRGRAVRRARRGRARGMGDVSYSQLPDYCYPLSPKYFQIPGNPGSNGVPDYATALSQCSAGSTSECQAQADSDAGRFAGLASQLQSQWSPLPDVSTAELKIVVDQMRMVVAQGVGPIISAEGNIGTSDDARKAIANFLDIAGDIQEQSNNYQKAIDIAKPSGVPVHAPELKNWVIAAITDMAQAIHFGSLILCSEPWWAGALSTLFSFMSAAIPVFKGIGGVILKVGENAVAAVEGGFGLIATLEKYAPIGLLALAAWWIFLREKKRTAAHPV